MIHLPRLTCVSVFAAVISIASPSIAADKKDAPKPAEKVSHGVSLRMVHKGTPVADTIEAYNSNTGYDAIIKFEYTKVATGAKSPEVVAGREKVEALKPVTIVNGGQKFKLLGVEIKDVELRTHM